METLLPGDIFLTRGHGFVARAIRFFTGHVGEARTQVNHVGLVVMTGSAHTAVGVEALERVVRQRLWDEYGGTGDELAVYRPICLPRTELQKVVAVANGMVGRDYGCGKVVLHALDWALQGVYIFRRLGLMADYPICSWLVVHAFGTVGVHFGVQPGTATPDDIWDHVTASPREFRCVRRLARVDPRGLRRAA